MRAHTTVTVFALIAAACLGSAHCGILTKLADPLKQAGNVGNALGDANQIPSLGNDSVSQGNGQSDVNDILPELESLPNVINPISGELGLLKKLLSLLGELLSAIKPGNSGEDGDVEESTTTASTEPAPLGDSTVPEVVPNKSTEQILLDESSASEEPLDGSTAPECETNNSSQESASESVDGAEYISTSAAEEPTDSSEDESHEDVTLTDVAAEA